MAAQGVDVLLLSVGPDLPYLTGYEAMPLERLTMLVVPRDGEATLVVPRLEAPRVVEQPDVFTLRPWDETEDPIAIVAELAAGAATAAVGDQMWARFLVELLPHLPGAGSAGPRRRRAAADGQGRRRDRRAARRRARRPTASPPSCTAARSRSSGAPRPRCPPTSRARLIAEGHDKVNFAIVAAGENAASPHHHAGDRVIREGEIVLCDFGGTMDGYCSDITRCVFTGEPPAEIAEAYAVLHEAQQPASPRRPSARRARTSTAPPARSSPTPASASTSSTAPATASAWRRTRTRTSSRATTRPLEAGHAFSVEPGIYVAGRWGMRLEDIVVATADGPGRSTPPTTTSSASTI